MVGIGWYNAGLRRKERSIRGPLGDAARLMDETGDAVSGGNSVDPGVGPRG